jgi:hypothetical protein
MSSKWLNTTEIVAGFIFRGKLDAHIVNPDDMYPPYNETIPTVRDSRTLDEAKERVIEKHGYSMWRDAVEASEAINSGTTPLNWVKILESLASKSLNGLDLEKIGRDLQEGKDVDLGKIMQATSQINLGYRALTPLSEVEPEKGTWIKTGYAPWDDNIGGVPKGGLTLICASPGIGKTTLALRLGLDMIRKNKKSKVAIFSLEMTLGQIVMRYIETDKKITIDERARILASESSYTVGEIYSVAARTAASEKLAAIIIDFADLMVEGEQSESVMGQIYRNLSILAKQTKVPVILVCQLNRTTYLGGIPKVNHIRYSGMAEAMAALIVLLYNPNNILADMKMDSSFAAEEGRGYIIVGKSRFGFLKGGPIAIKTEWDGLAGWGRSHFGTFAVTG